MVSNIYDLMIALVSNSVNFEVVHGQTTAKERNTAIDCTGSATCTSSPHTHGCFADYGDCLDENHAVTAQPNTRAYMLIEFGVETVRVDFGDIKHGRKFSRASLADNHRVKISEKELLAAINANRNLEAWSTGDRQLPVKYDGVGNILAFEGEITEIVNISHESIEIVVKTQNYAYTVANPDTVFELEPAFTNVSIPGKVVLENEFSLARVGRLIQAKDAGVADFGSVRIEGTFKPGYGVVATLVV